MVGEPSRELGPVLMRRGHFSPPLSSDQLFGFRAFNSLSVSQCLNFLWSTWGKLAATQATFEATIGRHSERNRQPPWASASFRREHRDRLNFNQRAFTGE